MSPGSHWSCLRAALVVGPLSVLLACQGPPSNPKATEKDPPVGDDSGLAEGGEGETAEAPCETCADSRGADALLDLDADGYAAESSEQGGDDCDDSDPRINPGATEVCDGQDNDCDGAADEVAERLELDGASVDYTAGCDWYHPDWDGDGWAAEVPPREGLAPTCTCGPPGDAGYPWVQQLGDCDDEDGDRFPGATPRCDDEPDDDCDGLDDDEDVVLGACTDLDVAETFCAEAGPLCQDWYQDADGDGVGDADTARCYCETELSDVVPADQVSTGDDCDDADASFWWITLYKDVDCDGYGAEADTGAPTCGVVDVGGSCVEADPAPTSSATIYHRARNNGDCDDLNPNISPAEQETCSTSGVDDDCDEDDAADEPGAAGCSTHYADADGDGYGVSSVVACLCAGEDGYASRSGDCDDDAPEINPGAAEVECDDVDNDCDDDSTDGTPEECAPETADTADSAAGGI